VSNAPEQQPFQGSAAHAAENDQVGCGRGVSDRVSGPAVCDAMDLEVDVETVCFQRGNLLGNPRLDLWLERLNVVRTAMTRHQFIYVDH
jgi:hypothetical protein